MPHDAVNRFGLTEVYKPAGAEVDVVFVHGLNGHPYDTWTSEGSKIFWPGQLLPPILQEEKTRIVVYGYDADVTSFTDGVSTDKIHNHAEHLVAELSANRRIRKATERPIIFIAHSLGGLLVKRALIYSSEIRGPKTEHLRSIFVSTYGILFLGTPHKGSNLAAWGSRLERICGAVLPKRVLDSSPTLVDALKSNNETLQNIDRQFMQLMYRYHIYFFHEGKPTDLKATRAFVVDEESASPNVQDVERAGIQADHSHMCKFENENAPGFDLVVEGIQRYAEAAPDTIRPRWEAEKDERATQRRFDANELSPHRKAEEDERATPGRFDANELSHYAIRRTSPPGSSRSTVPSPGNSSINLGLKKPQAPSRPNLKDAPTNNSKPPQKSSEPYFIVPPIFHPNKYFVGMEKELQQLDRHLFDKRRRDGTACVLIHGQPGVGKSHLVREYIFRNRRKYSGGTFWIPAKLREEIDHAFWTIHEKVVVRESLEAGMGWSPSETSWVESVKSWFEARHEWLIVFDGINVDKDEDATALQAFIPDSQNSSIIYISRAKSIESKQRLLRPYPIRVVPLKEDNARKLLFQELGIKKPTEPEIKRATELVNKIGGLPLVISAISHRLADTKEPLTKYNIKSYSADPKIGGTYNKILDELQERGHVEAWNLIHILCFFAQHIPMEMINLGLRALRSPSVNVKTSEGDGKPDINITIGILRRYALIERNEIDDRESMSLSRDSLVEPEPIDMLKIHSVVQNFCCDSLHDQNAVSYWLGVAVSLFSYSYRQADIRIKQKPDPGRVSDYRYYLVHGRRLRDHSIHYESRAHSLESLRTELDQVLEKIAKEIRIREPTSSQESVSQGAHQISIFDRTSSSSESGPSIHDEVRTPNPDGYRPVPPPLIGQNKYGFDVDGPSIDSPASLHSMSSYAGPRIVANSPRPLLPPYPDDGYESDLEHLYNQSALEMQKNPSDSTTARPPPPPPTTEEMPGHNEDDWQIVSLSKRLKAMKPTNRPRRDLGSFRPTITSTLARPKLDRKTVTGSVARSAQNPGEGSAPHSRRASDAFAALVEVQQRTPPQSSGGAGGGNFFWQHRPSSPLSTPRQPTYADVVAGESSQRGSKPRSSGIASTAAAAAAAATINMTSLPSDDDLNSSSHAQPPPLPLPRMATNVQLDESSPSEVSSGKRSNILHPSQSTSELIPRNENFHPIHPANSQQPLQEHYLPLGTNMSAVNIPTAPRPRSLGPHPNLHHANSYLSDSSRPRYTNENFNPNYHYYSPPPPIQGPNPASLPVEQNVTITPSMTKRQFPANYFQAPRHTPPFQTPTSQPSPSILRARMPAGPSSYYSPPYFPPGYSSQPLSPQPSHQSHPSLPETEPHRHHPSSLPPAQVHPFSPSFLPDRKRQSASVLSDPTDLPRRPSFIHLPSSPTVTIEDNDETLRGAGGWVFNSQPGPAELSMSRSSSGPGILIDGYPGDALGIVRFDEPGLMQFGEHLPISIEEARRRTYDREQRLLQLVSEEARLQKGLSRNTQRGRHVHEEREENREGDEEGERDGEWRGRVRIPYPDHHRVPT